VLLRARPVLLLCWSACLRADCRPCVRARGVPATASPPTGSPPQYSPALPRVTTGFGMGPGGSRALSATDTPHAPTHAATVCSSCSSRGGLRAPARPPTGERAHACRVPSPGERAPRLHRAHHEALSCDLRSGNTPSTIRTSPLQSVTSRPRLAYQPGRLPGVSRGRSPGGVSSWGGIPT